MSDDTRADDTAQGTAPKKERFGERVARLMKATGFTSQTAFAKKVGIDRSRLNRLLKDHTDPHPHEITWIAEALGETTDSLLGGIELPEKVRKTIDGLGELARRVLAAERERDEAKAKLAWAEERQAAERKHWAEEQASYERRLAEKGRDIERLVQGHQQTLRQQSEKSLANSLHMAVKVTEAERQRDELAASNEWLRALNKGLEQHLAKARSEKAGATVGAAGLALLGGILLGSARD